MCGRFQGVPIEIVEQIIRDIEMQNVALTLPDWPAVFPQAYPKSKVPIIVPDDGGGTSNLTAQIMQWGFEVSWGKNVVFNTRADSALKPGARNMWADSLESRRCVVPTLGFYEPHKTETFINPRSGKENKQQYFFTMSTSPFLFLAGIYESDHFSIMTTESNSSVSPIHDRMPVVLKPDELGKWLGSSYVSLFDRSGLLLDAAKE